MPWIPLYPRGRSSAPRQVRLAPKPHEERVEQRWRHMVCHSCKRVTVHADHDVFTDERRRVLLSVICNVCDTVSEVTGPRATAVRRHQALVGAALARRAA